ncbi:hypothetical protein [Salipiger mangrovisoli]|uniref:Uncharacterized protein n=1 Tax=Salipiger mangrovisoli TaxID=2865933 RepID=A0ABR9WZ43_9RHOB|nr:hypothetical protein [Salipiger mangrovisoli]MBE9636553.1 hypothetical protein [Salipiger mangrovisoli]
MRKAVKLSEVVWAQKVVSGEYPPAPSGMSPHGADDLWPLVEEKLGYGVGKRRVRYMLHDQGAKCSKPLAFYPPEWWNVVSIEEAARVVDDRGEETGEFVYQTPKPRKDGSVAIRLGRVTVIEAEIDGPEVGIPEAVRYALTWAEKQPRSARGRTLT